jgi:hypothetical protein
MKYHLVHHWGALEFQMARAHESNTFPIRADCGFELADDDVLGAETLATLEAAQLISSYTECSVKPRRTRLSMASDKVLIVVSLYSAGAREPLGAWAGWCVAHATLVHWAAGARCDTLLPR